jgi:hypothetical protein
LLGYCIRPSFSCFHRNNNFEHLSPNLGFSSLNS